MQHIKFQRNRRGEVWHAILPDGTVMPADMTVVEKYIKPGADHFYTYEAYHSVKVDVPGFGELELFLCIDYAEGLGIINCTAGFNNLDDAMEPVDKFAIPIAE